MVLYTWKTQMEKTDKDIKEYLEKRYEDYCRDTNQHSIEGKTWYKLREREKEEHCDKQDKLIILGFELKEKLNFFLDKSRKELFEQAIDNLKSIDSYYKDKHDNFCKELEETNNSLLIKYQKLPYELNNVKEKRKEELFEQKERIKDRSFVIIIDERKDNYKKMKEEYERNKPERERRKAIEKARKEREIRREGFSNAKPLSFYEEMYKGENAVCSYGGVDEDNEHIKEDQEFDSYFEEHGKPKGVWEETKMFNSYRTKERWYGDDCFSDKEIDKYFLVDNPDENQKYLNRCKEMVNILINLKDSEYNQNKKLHVEMLQKYLTEGYLITRQIAWFFDLIKHLLIEELSIDPNDPYKEIRDHPSKKYDFNIYKEKFDIIQIRKDVSEFVRTNEGTILTPIEWLKVYLKKHDNKITTKKYSLKINKSEKVARRILDGFVKEKKLKSRKIGSSHKTIYFV